VPVLLRLPADLQGVSRPVSFLPRARPAVRRLRRFRPGVPSRTRGRPSRARNMLGVSEQISRAQSNAQRAPEERAVGGLELGRAIAMARRLGTLRAARTARRRACTTRATPKRGLKAAAAIGDTLGCSGWGGVSIVPESFNPWIVLPIRRAMAAPGTSITARTRRGARPSRSGTN
jgi:hypothetical protein